MKNTSIQKLLDYAGTIASNIAFHSYIRHGASNTACELDKEAVDAILELKTDKQFLENLFPHIDDYQRTLYSDLIVVIRNCLFVIEKLPVNEKDRDDPPYYCIDENRKIFNVFYVLEMANLVLKKTRHDFLKIRGYAFYDHFLYLANYTLNAMGKGEITPVLSSDYVSFTGEESAIFEMRERLLQPSGSEKMKAILLYSEDLHAYVMENKSKTPEWRKIRSSSCAMLVNGATISHNLEHVDACLTNLIDVLKNE